MSLAVVDHSRVHRGSGERRPWKTPYISNRLTSGAQRRQSLKPLADQLVRQVFGSSTGYRDKLTGSRAGAQLRQSLKLLADQLLTCVLVPDRVGIEKFAGSHGGAQAEPLAKTRGRSVACISPSALRRPRSGANAGLALGVLAPAAGRFRYEDVRQVRARAARWGGFGAAGQVPLPGCQAGARPTVHQCRAIIWSSRHYRLSGDLARACPRYGALARREARPPWQAPPQVIPLGTPPNGVQSAAR